MNVLNIILGGVIIFGPLALVVALCYARRGARRYKTLKRLVLDQPNFIAAMRRAEGKFDELVDQG
jgi:hypothetical protein